MSHPILVVEDDPFVSGLLVDVLSAAAYTVTVTDSAFGAAALVRKLQPAAVILDVGLPFRPGTDLLAELKSDPRTAEVPVVVLSGLTESLNDERRALATAVLGKPIDIKRLLDTLVAACAHSPQASGAT
jgi:DNA-binding response OmpR family regulator